MFYVNASTGEGDRQTDGQTERQRQTDREKEEKSPCQQAVIPKQSCPLDSSDMTYS